MEHRHLTPDTLVAQLGLTKDQMDMALQIAEQARQEPVALGDVVSAFENIIRRFDEPEGAPAGAILDALAEYRGLLETGIALRSFAAGMRHQAERTAS